VRSSSTERKKGISKCQEGVDSGIESERRLLKTATVTPRGDSRATTPPIFIGGNRDSRTLSKKKSGASDGKHLNKRLSQAAEKGGGTRSDFSLYAGADGSEPSAPDKPERNTSQSRKIGRRPVPEGRGRVEFRGGG